MSPGLIIWAFVFFQLKPLAEETTLRGSVREESRLTPKKCLRAISLAFAFQTGEHNSKKLLHLLLLIAGVSTVPVLNNLAIWRQQSLVVFRPFYRPSWFRLKLGINGQGRRRLHRHMRAGVGPVGLACRAAETKLRLKQTNLHSHENRGFPPIFRLFVVHPRFTTHYSR